jgi:heme/copper-type cytochrome/quinol oxidase subunit 4
MSHYSNESSVEIRHDATERSLRSLTQGLALDVSVAVVLVLATAVGSLEWTPTYWKLLGLAVAKSAIQAGAAFLMRYYVTPKQSTPTA